MNVDDYIIMSQTDSNGLLTTPILPFTIINGNELFLTICFKLDKGYLPVKFLCSTEYVNGFYLREDTRILLNERFEENDVQTEYINICNSNDEIKKVKVSNQVYAFRNCIGLKMLDFLELEMSNNKFTLRKVPLFF